MQLPTVLSTIFLMTSWVLRDPTRPSGLYQVQGGGRVIACDSQNGHNFMGKKLQIPQFYALSICDGLNGPWKQLTGASTTIHVEVSVQILDTPAKRKLSFSRKDNCSPRVKIQHKLYLNLKLNITSSIYRYPSYHAFFICFCIFPKI